MIRLATVTALCAVQLVLGATQGPVTATQSLGAAASVKQIPSTASAIHVVSKKRDSPRVVRYFVSTPSLGRSTTTPIRINVILPRDYAKHRKRHYPVLFAFPGTSSTADQWLDSTDTLQLTRRHRLIVVAVDGGYNADGGGFYTNWVDQSTSLGVANWETFHTRELVPWVDSQFRTIKSRAGRATAGISQGGFGSLSYAARHPALFGAAAAFSGAVDIYQDPVCRAGASALIAGIMTGLNGVQPFAPFGDPVIDAANWRAHDPGSNVSKLKRTKVDLYVGQGQPGPSDLTDPAWPAGAGLEAAMHQSNECFKEAADAAGLKVGWHEYRVGLHTERYVNRALAAYLPRLMHFFSVHATAKDVARARLAACAEARDVEA